MKKQTRRSERVADLVRAEISRLVLMEAHDPELRKVTITDVLMPADLRSARVYFSALGGDEERDRALEALDRASSFLRREVGRRCQLRFVPELHFFADRSIERGARIEELLAEYTSPSAAGAAEGAEEAEEPRGAEEADDADNTDDAEAAERSPASPDAGGTAKGATDVEDGDAKGRRGPGDDGP